MLMNGAPGTGKSMLAKALPSILPPMNLEEILEVTHLHSLASKNYEQIVNKRPFVRLTIVPAQSLCLGAVSFPAQARSAWLTTAF